MTAVRCLVFDIDDTLYLERDYVRSGFLAVARVLKEQFAVEDFFSPAWNAFQSGVRGNTFNTAFSEIGRTDLLCQLPELVRVYRNHSPDIQLLPDAEQSITALKGSCRMYAITDGPLESQKAKAEALGLDHWLEKVVFTATLGPDAAKPNPLAFHIIEEISGCHGGECVYLADNPLKDFQAPVALGWRAIRIRRSGGLHYHSPCLLPQVVEQKQIDEALEMIFGHEVVPR